MRPELIDFTKCAYHESHQTRQVHVDLSKHRLDDVPKVPERLNRVLDLTVFAWDSYSDETFSRYDFCPGQDTVSFCLDIQGIWEPVETLAVLDILQKPGLVVDVGAHIGYYGALAIRSNCLTWLVEANREVADIAGVNCWLEPNRADAFMTVGLIQGLPPMEPQPIRLFIADVEGQEVAAVNYARTAFEGGEVDYALLEFSPTFNDSYPGLLTQLNAWGYVGFEVPHKGWPRLSEYADDPLGVLTSLPPVTVEVVESWIQENVIFVRGDLLVHSVNMAG